MFVFTKSIAFLQKSLYTVVWPLNTDEGCFAQTTESFPLQLSARIAATGHTYTMQ